MPTIRVSLNSKSIDEAIKQVEAYKKKVEKLAENVVHTAVEMGVETAKDLAMYMNAYDSGELVNGIVAEYDDPTHGRIVSTAPHSAFVEMGTGIVGKQNPGNSIPGWQYDVNEHGEEGWWYVGKDGKRHWTKGMPSRPYMYETAKMLKDSIPWIVEGELKK